MRVRVEPPATALRPCAAPPSPPSLHRTVECALPCSAIYDWEDIEKGVERAGEENQSKEEGKGAQYVKEGNERGPVKCR
jgi:hypothetical protein